MKILLASRKNKSGEVLIEYLKENISGDITTVEKGEAVKKLLDEEEFDLFFINSPLNDEPGHETAVRAARKSSAGVIFLIQNRLVEASVNDLEPYGIIVIGKPVVKSALDQAIQFARLSRNRMETLHEENRKLKSKIEQLKLVNRAKWVLVQYLNMTEDQAHKYIEQQAMNRRLTKAEVAEKILKTYEH